MESLYPLKAAWMAVILEGRYEDGGRLLVISGDHKYTYDLPPSLFTVFSILMTEQFQTSAKVFLKVKELTGFELETTVTKIVHKLRRKLEEDKFDAFELIETSPLGYRVSIPEERMTLRIVP